jgi:hypothetical protein
MLLILVVALLAIALTAGAWYGRLQERAWWTRRLMERGINPGTLHPRSMETLREPLEPLSPDATAMRDAMESMAHEVERLAEGQRFLTQVLTEKRALPPPSSYPNPSHPDSPRPNPSSPELDRDG